MNKYLTFHIYSLLIFFIVSVSLLSVNVHAAEETVPIESIYTTFPPSSSISQCIPALPSTLQNPPVYKSTNNIYDSLKVPTQITKLGDTYFIVDCYHDQIIYNKDLSSPLPTWKVLTKDVKQPHTIASDGTVYLVDDTENNRILVFEKVDGKLSHTQILNSVGNRPHYIVYDVPSSSFFVWSSLTGEMYILKRNQDTNQVYITEIRSIFELAGFYIRSFTILEDYIYFPSGNNSYITVADKNTFEVIKRYPVAASIAGMAQITKIQDYYYLTVSTDVDYNQNTATLLRTPDLHTLENGIYEDVFHYFGTGGTPYYISHFDNAYYLTHHRAKPGIWNFQINDNKIEKIRVIH